MKPHWSLGLTLFSLSKSEVKDQIENEGEDEDELKNGVEEEIEGDPKRKLKIHLE